MTKFATAGYVIDFWSGTGVRKYFGYMATGRLRWRHARKQLTQFANSLSKLTQNPARWKEIGAAASRTVAAEFAQPRQIEALESAYFEAIEQWRTYARDKNKCRER
jgi:hypothetical protein